MRLLRLSGILFVFSTFSYGQHAVMHGGSGGFSRGGFAGGSFRGGYAPPPSPGNSPGPGFRSNFRHDNRPFLFPRNGNPLKGNNRFRGRKNLFFVWGYPYLWSSIFDGWDNWDNFDPEQTGNYAAQQPCKGSGVCGYQPQPDDQANPPAGEQAQPSSSSLRAPNPEAQAPFQPSGALVFKNGNILEYKWVTPKTAHGPR